MLEMAVDEFVQTGGSAGTAAMLGRMLVSSMSKRLY